MQWPENGQHRVVIPLRNGIELVVVTTGTGDGHSQEGRSGGSHDVVEFVVFGLDLVIRLIVVDSHAQEAGGHHRIFPGIPRPTVFFQQRRGQFIAGDLLADELVVGLVLIEGADHVVPVAPCFAFFSVPLVAIALGKPDDIQPVAPPPLSIARTGQQRLDLPRPSLRRRIAFEGRDLLGGRWQPHQIDMEPPQEFPRAGLRTQADFFLGKLLTDKSINGVGARWLDSSRDAR